MLSEHHVSRRRLPAQPDPGRRGVRRRHVDDPDLGGRAAGQPLRPDPAGRGDRRRGPPVRRPGELHARPGLPARGVRPLRRRVGDPRRATSRPGSAGCSRRGRTGAVTPGPYSQPHPMLFYGGGSVAAAQARARLGLHFQPQVGGPELKAVYEEECRAQGREPGYTLLAAGRPGQRLLRRGPGPLLGRARPLPPRRRPGVRRVAGGRHDVVRPRRLLLGRGDARRRCLRRPHRRRADREVPVR